MTNYTLARRLYEAYCASSAWKNYRGDECPQWIDLPPAIQDHWQAAACEATKLVTTSRRVERDLGGTWMECDFEDLKEGDMFRMFEPDGSLVDGQSKVKVTGISDHGAVKADDGSPVEHEKQLRDQMKYLEYQIHTLDGQLLNDQQKIDATRKMRMRYELLRLALETASQK